MGSVIARHLTSGLLDLNSPLGQQLPLGRVGQRHSVHGCAQKGTSTWVTHSQGPRQTAVPPSCKMSPPPFTPTHPAVISQVYYSHTQCPRSHTHTCMHDKDMQLQSVTETEKSQVRSHIQLAPGRFWRRLESNISTVTERAIQ